MSNQQLPKVISLENGKLTRFKTTIEFKKAQLTGILAVKQINDTLNAVFLNEFGIKGFTFSIINNKCKVDNLLGPMNKWYIRKTLASDFNCIFSAEQNLIVTESRIADSIILFNSGEKVIGRLTLQADSSIVFENIKHNIFYKMSIIH